MKDLLSLSKTEFKQFLDSFDTILTDVDGVLINFLGSDIPEVDETISILKNLGKTVHYITNNSMLTPENYAQKLVKFNGKMENVVIPVLPLIEYLKSVNFKKKVYVLGVKNFAKYFEDAGIPVADRGPELVPETKQSFINTTVLDPEVGAVVVDLDVNINYSRIMKAAHYVLNPDVLFLCAAADTRLPHTKGVELIGPGKYLQLIEEFTNRKAIVFGKPTKRILDYILQNRHVDPKRTLFIGDTLDQDISLARLGGFISLLTLTGLITLEEATAADEDVKPDYYVKSLADLNPLLKDIQSNL